MLPERGIEGEAAEPCVNQLRGQRAAVGFQAGRNGGQPEIHRVGQEKRCFGPPVRPCGFTVGCFADVRLRRGFGSGLRAGHRTWREASGNGLCIPGTDPDAGALRLSAFPEGRLCSLSVYPDGRRRDSASPDKLPATLRTVQILEFQTSRILRTENV